MKLKLYDTPKECLAAFFGVAPDMLNDAAFGGERVDGEEVSDIALKDTIEGIETQGIWGYTDAENETIHYWVNKERVTRATMHYFFGNQVSRKDEPADLPTASAEARAACFGEVSEKAYLLVEEAMA